MQRIEVNNVEYGDCISLLGRNKTMLMVDCGSINNRLRNPDIDMHAVFAHIGEKYSVMASRHFLLTHYHRDHLCGFQWLLREKGEYFHRVYIPWIPCDEQGRSPLLDFALFAHVFLPCQSDCSRVNTNCLNVFWTLKKYMDSERIFTLKSGDTFNFDSVIYEVLNPDEKDFTFDSLFKDGVEEINVMLSNPYLPPEAQRFMALKERFSGVYHRCLQAFSSVNRGAPLFRDSLCEQLESIYNEIEGLKPLLNSLAVSHDIKTALEGQSLNEAYGAAVNSCSVVFHNVRSAAGSNQDILMTGDITDAALERLYPKLYHDYYIVKAPHHGTESGYSRIFKNMGISHLIISSGDYKSGGDISPSYQSMETVKHCTNNSKCKWFQTSGGCCNRLNYCYEMEGGAGLTIKCPGAGKSLREMECGIYVAAPTGSRGCFCDS